MNWMRHRTTEWAPAISSFCVQTAHRRSIISLWELCVLWTTWSHAVTQNWCAEKIYRAGAVGNPRTLYGGVIRKSKAHFCPQPERTDPLLTWFTSQISIRLYNEPINLFEREIRYGNLFSFGKNNFDWHQIQWHTFWSYMNEPINVLFESCCFFLLDFQLCASIWNLQRNKINIPWLRNGNKFKLLSELIKTYFCHAELLSFCNDKGQAS